MKRDPGFIKNFEEQVRKTIEENRLLSEKDKIIVACSGGKDSTTVLYLLKKFGYNVEAMIIDLLMGEWSRKNLHNIKEFCNKYGIKLRVVSIRDEAGYSICYIRSVLKPKVRMKSCAICGIIKKYVLNKKAREFRASKIVLGHNMDDEAQTVMMNIFGGNPGLGLNMGPVMKDPKTEKFVPRVKPLYFTAEKDVEKYSRMMGFPVLYDKCPCSVGTFRRMVRKWLNDFEKMEPKAKQNIINNFLKLQPVLRKFYMESGKIRYCEKCREPARNRVCRTCELMGKLRE